MRNLTILTVLFSALAQAQTAHVVVIGVDGMGAAAVRGNPTPRIHSLMSSGAWSLKARGVMPTVSSPNWASMIMGAGPEQHGVISNEWKPDKFEFSPVCHGMAATFPTIFGILHQQQPSSRVSILHEWDDFARLVEPGAAALVRHLPNAADTVAAAIAEWREHQPTLLFVHIDEVDHAGHGQGWESEEYRAAVAKTDALIGTLVDAVAATPAASRTAFLISADHGGVGKKHGGNTMTELEIPWIASGAGIVRKGELARPINTYDTAATIASLLKLKTPDCWLGRPLAEALEHR